MTRLIAGRSRRPRRLSTFLCKGGRRRGHGRVASASPLGRDAQLVGSAPLVVGLLLVSPSVLAVVLRGTGFTEDVGGLGSLTVGPCGALMPSGRTLVLTTPGPLVIVFTVIRHRRSLSRRGFTIDAARHPNVLLPSAMSGLDL